MYFRILLLACAPPLVAADPRQLALATRAQTDFDRVHLSSAPVLEDAARCVQSQAAVLPVTAPESLPLLHFRQGYCALTGALLSHDRRGFDDAARSFDQALATWAARPRDKKALPEPEPAAVVALAAIARLALGGVPDAGLEAAGARLEEARRSGACPAAVMPAAECRDILAVAAVWQGWVAVGRDRLEDAGNLFPSDRAPGWKAWAEGRLAFGRRQYTEAAEAFARAVDAWSALEKNRTARIPDGLRPPVDLASALTDLGGARIAAADPRVAISPLDAAVRRDPNRPRAWFLRARARGLTGDAGGALADLNMAARTALAGAGEHSTGEGRFYRGIWSFLKGDLEAAESEFAEAQNAGLPLDLAADASAWRALAAVQGGSCGTSREKLESALALASPFFPKAHARAAAASCGRSPARVSEVR
jgi:tetratricopeptide (TPR) repeat protein